MFHSIQSKWFYVAGSGVVLGLFNYFYTEKKYAQTSWIYNFQPTAPWDYNWDKRDFSHKSSSSNLNAKMHLDENANIKTVPTADRHIFMIRHGQYYLKGKNDLERHLTPLGRKQANLVGQRLKSLEYDYTKIVHSSMTRAIETSSIIEKSFPTLPVETCNLLEEGAPIKPDPPLNTFAITDEEFLKDGKRIEAAFRKHFHRADITQEKDSYEIMVFHANVIRYFICRLLQFPPQAWLRFQLRHCSITHVIIRPSGRVGVYSIGDAGFLPLEDISS